MKLPLPAPQLPQGSNLSLAGMLGLLLLAFVLVGIWLGIYRIDAGHVGIVKRFGNVIEVVDPGLHY